MKLKELVNKIDNDIVLWIVRGPDANVLFKRENCLTVSVVTLVSTCTLITVTAQKKKYILTARYGASMRNTIIIQ